MHSIVPCHTMIYSRGSGLHAASAQPGVFFVENGEASFGSSGRVRARCELGWLPCHLSMTDWIEREMPLD